MSFRRGEVRIDGHRAGRIEETATGYRFAYDPAYVGRSNPQPASLGLPVRTEPYESKTLFAFFDGLIPEGWLLHIAEKTWKLDPRDRMGLLLACCADCIGNVSVIPEGA